MEPVNENTCLHSQASLQVSLHVHFIHMFTWTFCNSEHLNEGDIPHTIKLQLKNHLTCVIRDDQIAMMITSLPWVELGGDLHAVIDSQCSNLRGHREGVVISVSPVAEKESEMTTSSPRIICASRNEWLPHTKRKDFKVFHWKGPCLTCCFFSAHMVKAKLSALSP